MLEQILYLLRFSQKTWPFRIALVVLGVVFISLVAALLSQYSTERYLVGHFQNLRNSNTQKLAEMRGQVDEVFSVLRTYEALEYGLTTCSHGLLDAQVKLVDANRFIYETALELDSGELCSSYGTLLSSTDAQFSFIHKLPGFVPVDADSERIYWFNAGPEKSLDQGEVIIREGRALLRINKGILLDALRIDGELSFAVFEKGNPAPLLSHGQLPLLAGDSPVFGQVFSVGDSLNYAYPLRWEGLFAVESLPSRYRVGVFLIFMVIYAVNIGLLIGLLLYVAARCFSLEARLRGALKHSQLQMHYQPIVDMRSGRIVGAEALMRWTLAGRPVSPETFITMAEERGLIGNLTEWCCEQVAKDMSVTLSCFKDLYVTINLSSVALASADIARKLHTILAHYSVRPLQVVFEVTESFAVAGEFAQSQLWYLRELGYQVSLEDFDFGSSNLTYLERLPVSAIKVDKRFVTPDKMHSSDGVWWRIISIARSLNLIVIAEGIEGTAQVTPLLNVGVIYGQGYFYSPAVPFEQFFLLFGANHSENTSGAPERGAGLRRGSAS